MNDTSLSPPSSPGIDSKQVNQSAPQAEQNFTIQHPAFQPPKNNQQYPDVPNKFAGQEANNNNNNNNKPNFMNYHQPDGKGLEMDRNDINYTPNKDEDSESEEIDLTTPTINTSSPVIVNGIIDYSKGVN